MKPDLYMYHPNVFHLPEKEGVHKGAGECRIQRKTKKRNEINNTSTLISPNNTLQNIMKVAIFLM